MLVQGVLACIGFVRSNIASKQAGRRIIHSKLLL